MYDIGAYFSRACIKGGGLGSTSTYVDIGTCFDVSEENPIQGYTEGIVYRVS